MTDANIKKVIIPFSELPGSDSLNFSYNVRYRIVSEDKNRVSHWSRVYNLRAEQDLNGNPLIPSFDYNYVKENSTLSGGGVLKTVRFNWVVPADYEQFRTFDVFVKRCSSGACTEDYAYLATTSTNSYTITQTGSETHIRVLVQTPVYPKEITSSAKLFETVVISL